jgi:manganese/zinc/iron transport system permease protein
MRMMSAEDRRVWLLIGAMAFLVGLFVPFSQIVLQVDYNYTLRTVALGGALLGVVSGVLGCFAVLRRQSLLGDALSHAALPGVALAFLLAGRELSLLLIGAGVTSWLGVHFIHAVTKTTRLKQDAAMGVVLAAWFAAGIALLAYIQARPDASQAGLDTFIFGQAAAIVTRDVQLITGVGLVSFLMLGLFWKEFKLITFDPEFAGANGFRVSILNMGLSTLIVVAIVLGLQLAGVILMVGMLIAPGIAARQWTNKLDQMIMLSAVFGAFAGGAGAIISAVDTGIPTGPLIIVVASLIVLVSIAFAPERGLAWSWLRRRRDQRRFAAQTVLRDLYHYAIDHGSPSAPVPGTFLVGVGGSSAKLGLQQLAGRGLVQPQAQGDAWMLTPAGLDLAIEDAQNRQLWAAYRQYSDELALPQLAENHLQDIRQLLPGEAVKRLERKLLEGATA